MSQMYDTKYRLNGMFMNSGCFYQGAGAQNGVGASLASLTHAEASRVGYMSSSCNDRSLDAGRTSDRFQRRFRACRATPGTLLRFKQEEDSTFKGRASRLRKSSGIPRSTGQR